MKKKLVLLVLMASVPAVLTACGGKDQQKNTETVTEEAATNVKLGDYKNFSYKPTEVAETTDEDVENEINFELQQDTETKQITDRKVQEGDTVSVTYTETVEDSDPETVENSEIIIGEGYLDDEFEKQIIGADPGKGNRLLLLVYILYIPDLLLKSIRAAVKIVIIFILCKLILSAINGKLRSSDTIPASSNDRTEKASINLISPDIVISKDHILQISVLIRNTYLHQDRTILKHFRIGTFFILKMIDFYFFSCRKCPKFPFRNTHVLIPPIYEKRATNRLYVFNRLIPGCRSLIFDA